VSRFDPASAPPERTATDRNVDRTHRHRAYPARSERAALCDLLVEIGPDQPTLCDGWHTRDLAAHLIVRERRPDAAIGIVVPSLRRWTESVRAKTARQHSFQELINLLRRPPAFSLAGLPLTDRATNTAEFFIHHEDIRRGAADWTPRELDPTLESALYSQFKLMARLRLRRFPAQLEIHVQGHDAPIRGGCANGRDLAIEGDIGELTMFFSGRQRAARVEIRGAAELSDRLRAAHFSI
jgi:uncharacterized protein (TIGR03085 family)